MDNFDCFLLGRKRREGRERRIESNRGVCGVWWCWRSGGGGVESGVVVESVVECGGADWTEACGRSSWWWRVVVGELVATSTLLTRLLLPLLTRVLPRH